MDANDGLERFGFLHDVEGRAARARRIVTALRDFVQPDLGRLRVLDIGCSSGLITRELARHVSACVGVDRDVRAVAWAAANTAGASVAYLAASGEALPFAETSFDVVVCNHVYEHTGDARRLMSEILRVLVPGGSCWFAAGHSWQIVEPHYHIPMLSMVPRRLAGAILRASGRGDAYDIRFVAPWAVPRLFRGFEQWRLVSVDVLRDPGRYELRMPLLGLAAARMLVRAFARPLAWLAPTQLWLLRKG